MLVTTPSTAARTGAWPAKGEGKQRMGQIQRSVVIQATPEEVFALLTDTGRFGEWVAGYGGLVSGPERAGLDDSYSWRFRIWKLAFKERSTIVELDPPRELTEELRGLVRGTLTKTVVPQKRRTQLRWDFHYRLPGGPLGGALDWLLARRVARRAIEASLQGAKQVLEAPKQAAAAQRGRRRQPAVR